MFCSFRFEKRPETILYLLHPAHDRTHIQCPIRSKFKVSEFTIFLNFDLEASLTAIVSDSVNLDRKLGDNLNGWDTDFGPFFDMVHPNGALGSNHCVI